MTSYQKLINLVMHDQLFNKISYDYLERRPCQFWCLDHNVYGCVTNLPGYKIQEKKPHPIMIDAERNFMKCHMKNISAK